MKTNLRVILVTGCMDSSLEDGAISIQHQLNVLSSAAASIIVLLPIGGDASTAAQGTSSLPTNVEIRSSSPSSNTSQCDRHYLLSRKDLSWKESDRVVVVGHFPTTTEAARKQAEEMQAKLILFLHAPPTEGSAIVKELSLNHAGGFHAFAVGPHLQEQWKPEFTSRKKMLSSFSPMLPDALAASSNEGCNVLLVVDSSSKEADVRIAMEGLGLYLRKAEDNEIPDKVVLLSLSSPEKKDLVDLPERVASVPLVRVTYELGTNVTRAGLRSHLDNVRIVIVPSDLQHTMVVTQAVTACNIGLLQRSDQDGAIYLMKSANPGTAASPFIVKADDGLKSDCWEKRIKLANKLKAGDACSKLRQAVNTSTTVCLSTFANAVTKMENQRNRASTTNPPPVTPSDMCPDMETQVLPIISVTTIEKSPVLLINQDGLETLATIRCPLNCIASIGKGRCGKSFFLSFLVSELMDSLRVRPPVFNSQAGNIACTQGADVLVPPLPIENLKQYLSNHGCDVSSAVDDDDDDDKAKGANTHPVVFMDLEGTGDTERSQTQEIQIMLPALMASKVILFQTKEYQASQILNSLHELAEAAHVMAGDQTSMHMEEESSRGNSSEEDTDEDETDDDDDTKVPSKALLGSVIVVIRDFLPYQGKVEDIDKQLRQPTEDSYQAKRDLVLGTFESVRIIGVPLPQCITKVSDPAELKMEFDAVRDEWGAVTLSICEALLSAMSRSKRMTLTGTGVAGMWNDTFEGIYSSFSGALAAIRLSTEESKRLQEIKEYIAQLELEWDPNMLQYHVSSYLEEHSNKFQGWLQNMGVPTTISEDSMLRDKDFLVESFMPDVLNNNKCLGEKWLSSQLDHAFEAVKRELKKQVNELGELPVFPQVVISKINCFVFKKISKDNVVRLLGKEYVEGVVSRHKSLVLKECAANEWISLSPARGRTLCNAKEMDILTFDITIGKSKKNFASVYGKIDALEDPLHDVKLSMQFINIIDDFVPTRAASLAAYLIEYYLDEILPIHASLLVRVSLLAGQPSKARQWYKILKVIVEPNSKEEYELMKVMASFSHTLFQFEETVQYSLDVVGHACGNPEDQMNMACGLVKLAKGELREDAIKIFENADAELVKNNVAGKTRADHVATFLPCLLAYPRDKYDNYVEDATRSIEDYCRQQSRDDVNQQMATLYGQLGLFFGEVNKKPKAHHYFKKAGEPRFLKVKQSTRSHITLGYAKYISSLEKALMSDENVEAIFNDAVNFAFLYNTREVGPVVRTFADWYHTVGQSEKALELFRRCGIC